MRLLITDPAAVVADELDVASIRAEDDSGGFGVLPGHADFLTTLVPSIVSWRAKDGKERYCAVGRGILTVRGGSEVLVSTREAHLGDDLQQLETIVLSHYRAEAEEERAASTTAARLRIQTIRQIVQSLRGGGALGLNP